MHVKQNETNPLYENVRSHMQCQKEYHCRLDSCDISGKPHRNDPRGLWSFMPGLVGIRGGRAALQVQRFHRGPGLGRDEDARPQKGRFGGDQLVPNESHQQHENKSLDVPSPGGNLRWN